MKNPVQPLTEQGKQLQKKDKMNMEGTSTTHILSDDEYRVCMEDMGRWRETLSYEKELSLLDDQISHLEAVIMKLEDERDHYKRMCGCA